MTAAALVQSAVAGGITIRIDGDNLVLSSQAEPAAQLLELLKSAKAEVLVYLYALSLWTEEDWTSLYDERAGIMEFDGGLHRDEAESKAADEVNILRSLARSAHGS